MPVVHPRSDIWIYFVVATVAVLALAIDPNRHFASENDVYMLRQVEALRELAPWRWDLADPAQATLQAAFWFANLSFYFHGPLPPLLQAIFLDLAESVLGTTGVGPYLASAGLFYVLGALAFTATLRGAGLPAGLSVLGGLALCASPVWLALSRGFGASWLVAVVFGQAFALWAAQRALEGRRNGPALLAAALGNLLVSDVLAPFGIAALLAGIAVASRDAPGDLRRMFGSRWMLLPAACCAWIVAINIYVFARGVTHPSDVVLFAYPFAQYIVGLPGQAPSVGALGWMWVDRARILLLLFGLGVLAAVPAALAGALRMSSLRADLRAQMLLVVWAGSALAGFGAIFLFFSGPSTGSQAMPMIGYPIYLLAPGVALLASGLSRLAARGRRAIACLAGVLWIAGSAAGAWIYVWRVPVPGPGELLTVREGTDVVGFRYPDAGIMGAGGVVRAAIGGAAPEVEAVVAAIVDPAAVPLRNILFWRAGVIDGGYFARTGGRCIARTAVDTGGRVIEKADRPSAEAMARRVAATCAAPICVGVGNAQAPQDWRIDVAGEAGRSVAVIGFGIARPAGFAERAESVELERRAPAGDFGLAGAPIGFAGMVRALRLSAPDCGTSGGS